jgi:hypothetical protein
MGSGKRGAPINPTPSRSLSTADEGMTHQILIFVLYGFKPRSKPVKRMIKAHKDLYLAQPRKPKLGMHWKDSREKI